MISREEKKNQQMAFVISIGIHAVVFLLLFFIVAWRAPNPPLPEYGIELNFGTDDQGSGEIQPETPVGAEPKETETQEMEEPVQEESKPVEVKTEEQQVTVKEESPVSVKEVKKETKPVEVKPKEDVKKEDPKAVFNPDKSKTTNTKQANKEGKSGSQGDDTGKSGDKGDPKGNVDAKALYGNAGGGDGGTGLDLNGWEWDYIPKPDVPDNETGRIVFEIEVDDNGELIKYRKESGSVSAAAERACIAAIEKLTFSKKSGAKVPPVSKGKITFVIRAK